MRISKMYLNLGLMLSLMLCVGSRAMQKEQDQFKMEILIPEQDLQKPDDYLCTPIRFNETLVVTAVNAIYIPGNVHHINMYGCSSPVERAETHPTKAFSCRGVPKCPGNTIPIPIIGWVPGEELTVPQGKAFVVGPGSNLNTFWVQVHYVGWRPKDDVSGVALYYHRAVDTPAPYVLGEIVQQISGFALLANTESTKMSATWCYDGFDPLIGYAIRPHAHHYGYYEYIRRHTPGDPAQHHPMLAEADPSHYQGYLALNEETRVLHGDSFEIACWFNTTGVDYDIRSGTRDSDEMCIVHLAVYSKMLYSVWHFGGNGYMTESLMWSKQASLYVLPWSAPEQQRKVDYHDNIVSGIAKAPTGDPYLWLFSTGDRSWEGSFNAQFKLQQAAPLHRPTVLQIDVDTGALVKGWGSNTFYMPHMISLDREGNMWTADAGAHQVFKHSPQGEQLLALGQPLTPGLGDSSLCQPTHAVVSQQGTIYVADGHCNSRIVQYSADGTFEKEYLLPATEPTFPAPLPHSLALNECDQVLWVADQAGARILGFDLKTREFTYTWSFPEDSALKPYAVRTNVQKSILVLAWDGTEGGTSKLYWLTVKKRGLQSTLEAYSSWYLPGLVSPHDLEISPAPLGASRTGARGLAVLVTDLKSDGDVKRYVIENDVLSIGQNGLVAEQYSGRTYEPPAGVVAIPNEIIAENSTSKSKVALYLMLITCILLVSMTAVALNKQMPRLRGYLQGYRQPSSSWFP